MERIHFTRKIQLLIDSEDRDFVCEARGKLMAWSNACYCCANLVYTHQFIQEQIKDMVYLKIRSIEELLLRGFLTCPKCERIMSSSASKSKTKYVHYYHCNSKCGVRFNAKFTNGKFVEMLKGYTLNPVVLNLYKVLITQTYNIAVNEGKNEVSAYKKQLDDYHTKITRARDLLLNGDIDGTNYKKIKTDCERRVSILGEKLVELSRKTDGIGPLLGRILQNISLLVELYEKADSKHKRHMLNSMFPEKLTFDGE